MTIQRDNQYSAATSVYSVDSDASHEDKYSFPTGLGSWVLSPEILKTCRGYEELKTVQSRASIEQEVASYRRYWNLGCILAHVRNILFAQDTSTIANVPDNSDPESRILHHVRKITEAEGNTLWSERKYMYWMMAIAEYIDSGTGGSEERAIGTGRSGVSKATDIYERYIRQEFASTFAYEERVKQQPAFLSSRKRFWRKRRDGGSRLVAFVKEFGEGVLLCLPKIVTPTKLMNMRWVQADSTIKVLKQNPETALFRGLCQFAAPWIKGVLSGEATVAAYRHDFCNQLRELLTHESNIATVIEFWPFEKDDYTVGILRASPKKNSLKRLLSREWVNDEVVNAVLGLAAAKCDEDGIIRPILLDSLQVERMVTSRNAGVLKDKGPRAQFIFPFNQKNCHWAMMRIVLEELTIYTYDSYVTNQVPGTELVNLLNHSFQAAWKLKEVSVVQQTDTVNCGIHAIATGISLLRKQDIPAVIDPKMLRVRYAQDIIHSCVDFWADPLNKSE